MLLVLSSLFGATGGIPSFNRLLVRAALEHSAARDRRLTVVALTDAVGTQPPAELAETARYLPCGGDRQLCAARTAKSMVRSRPVLFGHVNLAPLGLVGLPLGLRYGVIAHGTEVWSELPGPRRLALRRAHVVACVSDDTARHVSAVQGVAASRCARIINAIDALPPLVEPEPGPRSAQPLELLSVTRLHPGEPKGIDLMLHAIAGLPRGSVRYTVIGDGADRPRLRALSDALGIAAEVRFAGSVSDEARDRALGACELFALPSSSEGFGIVYLEAMAHGKPCLGARAGGTPEVVLDEQTGLLVAPSALAVRAALVRLAEPSLRERLGRAGRARVAEHFTYPAFRRHAVALFDRLLS